MTATKLPRTARPETRRQRGSLFGPVVMFRCEELGPDVAVFSPFGRDFAGELELFDVELAVAIGANVFDTGAAELEHVAPAARLDGHAEAAEAGAAAIALVPEGEVEEAVGEEKPDSGEGGVGKVPAKLVLVEVEQRGDRGPEEIQEPEGGGGAEGRSGELQQQEAPVSGL